MLYIRRKCLGARTQQDGMIQGLFRNMVTLEGVKQALHVEEEKALKEIKSVLAYANMKQYVEAH